MAEPFIQIEDVHKSYGRGSARQEILKGISLTVAAGEMLALIGQSGSGKTTLLNLIGGLDRPDSGSIAVAGISYEELGEQALAHLRNERIGFIFQAFHLLEHLTLVENVALPGFFSAKTVGSRGNGHAHASEALARVGLERMAYCRPGVLSGGQKQRVAIARALFNKPSLLLCDEPTGNLDSGTGKEVIAFFQELNRLEGTTLVLVTHEDRVARAASRVVRIVDGRIEDHATGSAELAVP
ncbi:MAG: ABC transporter ATP-binding protein [Pseudomonadota bacterium]